MDNAKIFLAKLKKYHFWVLSGLIVLLVLVAWQMAAMDMSARAGKRTTEVTQVFSEVKTVASDSKPENATTVEAIKNSQDTLADSVYQAWDFLYNAQLQRNPWPKDLPQTFLEVVPARRPGSSIPKEFCEQYHYFIGNHLPKLREIIDIRLPASEKKSLLDLVTGRTDTLVTPKKKPSAAKTTEKTGPEKGEKKKDAKADVPEEESLVGKCVLNSGCIAQVEQQYEWPATPTPAEIWFAQENLWVYEALLRIVAETNDGAQSFYSAPVKEIVSLGIAQQAGGGSMGAGGSSGGMGGMAGMGAMGEMMKNMMGGKSSATGLGDSASASATSPSATSSGSGGGAAEGMGSSLKDSRYVDTKGKPLSGSDEPPFAEFNMMPVRLVLLMDYRKVPKLLAKCANSSMPVEVRRITLFPADGSASGGGGASGMGGMGGMGGGGASGMGGMGGMGGGGASSMGAGMPAGMAAMMGSGAKTGMGGGMPAGMAGMMGSGAKTGMGGGTPGTGRSSGSSGGSGRGGGVSSTDEQLGSYDMRVEVQGIIFIFNQPDKARLGKGAASQAIAAGKTDAPTSSKPETAAVPAATTTTPPAAPADKPTPAAPAAGKTPAVAAPPSAS